MMYSHTKNPVGLSMMYSHKKDPVAFSDKGIQKESLSCINKKDSHKKTQLNGQTEVFT